MIQPLDYIFLKILNKILLYLLLQLTQESRYFLYLKYVPFKL